MDMSIPLPAPVTAAGGRLVTADDRELPLRATRLRAEARAGLAGVVVEQRFANPWPEPLTVTYSLALPHAAAVAGFAFRIGDRRVTGEIERVGKARERFERALMEGRSAGLLEQERASLFTQQLGNVPPDGEVVAEITLDQPLDWLPEGTWEWRFPTVAAPRYLGAPGRTPDAGRVAQEVLDRGDGPTLDFELTVHDTIPGAGTPTSPSHGIDSGHAHGAWTIRPAGDAPDSADRDLVVRWPAAGAKTGVTLDVARPASPHPGADHAYGLLTVVPPLPPHAPAPIARDVVLLLDTSGSMSGEPIARARQVAAAVVAGLGERDTLEMVEFSTRPSRWRAEPQPVTGEVRNDALRWIGGLRARGGTEMVAGMLEALRPRRSGAQRQVVLITDGLIGFEHEVVRAVRGALEPASRLHCVGIGPAPNRSLTTPCARAGRGTEVLVGLDDEVDAAAARLLARLDAPMLADLALAGDALVRAVPAALPDLHAGAPARIALELRPQGGELMVTGRTSDGPWQERIQVPPCDAGHGAAAIPRLHAREAVEDLETERAAGAGSSTIDFSIERLGLVFGIATRLTAWVAISEERDVDPRAPLRRVRQPQLLPQGLSAEGLGLAQVRERMVPSACMAPSRGEALRTFVDEADLEDLTVSESITPLGSSQSLPEGAVLDASSWRAHGLVAHEVHRDGERLVLEIESRHGARDWAPPDGVTLVYIRPGSLEDPEEVEVEVDLDASSAPGEIPVGGRVRLVLRIPADCRPDRPTHLLLTDPLLLLPVED